MTAEWLSFVIWWSFKIRMTSKWRNDAGMTGMETLSFWHHSCRMTQEWPIFLIPTSFCHSRMRMNGMKLTTFHIGKQSCTWWLIFTILFLIIEWYPCFQGYERTWMIFDQRMSDTKLSKNLNIFRYTLTFQEVQVYLWPSALSENKEVPFWLTVHPPAYLLSSSIKRNLCSQKEKKHILYSNKEVFSVAFAMGCCWREIVHFFLSFYVSYMFPYFIFYVFLYIFHLSL